MTAVIRVSFHRIVGSKDHALPTVQSVECGTSRLEPVEEMSDL